MVIAGVVVVENIERLPRGDFHRLFVKGLCQTMEFGHLAAAGATDLSDAEKTKVVEALAQFIPFGAKLEDKDLDIIAHGITSRSVALR